MLSSRWLRGIKNHIEWLFFPFQNIVSRCEIQHPDSTAVMCSAFDFLIPGDWRLENVCAVKTWAFFVVCSLVSGVLTADDCCNWKFHFNGKGCISTTVKSCSRACLWGFFFPCMFSSRCSGHKMISLPLQTLDCEGQLHYFIYLFIFYFTVQSTLNFTRATAGPSCPVAPGRNIMFVYLRREFIPLIHWPAPLPRLEGFDFLFIYSLHFFPPAR